MVDKHSAPAFSMGHPPTSRKNIHELSPGPASYDNLHPHLHNTSAAILKTSDIRFKPHHSIVPGPGSYSNQIQKDHIPTALMLSRSIDKHKEQLPGPGHYDPNYKKLIKSNSGYKIGQSQKIADITGPTKKMPGPGDYETNKTTFINTSSPVIGKQKRADLAIKNDAPGPGQYNKEGHSQQFTMKSEPKTVFGRSGRSLSTSNIVPGPGAYTYADNITEGVNKSKGFSMSSKIPLKLQGIDKLPGPASYHTDELDKLKHKIVSFSVGKAQKLKIQNEKQIISTPGPQNYAYNILPHELKNCVFGKSKRSSLANDNSLPGPGAYNAKLQSTLPQFSIPKQKLGWIKNSVTPGPGSYQPKIDDGNQYNRIKLSKDERKPFYDEKKNIPGPGSYNYSPDRQVTGYKIGNEKRGETKNVKVPGPGDYNIPSTISNLPRYSH